MYHHSEKWKDFKNMKSRTKINANHFFPEEQDNNYSSSIKSFFLRVRVLSFWSTFGNQIHESLLFPRLFLFFLTLSSFPFNISLQSWNSSNTFVFLFFNNLFLFSLSLSLSLFLSIFLKRFTFFERRRIRRFDFNLLRQNGLFSPSVLKY